MCQERLREQREEGQNECPAHLQLVHHNLFHLRFFSVLLIFSLPNFLKSLSMPETTGQTSDSLVRSIGVEQKLIIIREKQV